MKKAALAAASLPVALAVTPAARWGHQAVYVKSKQAMYVVGGQVSNTGTEITNEVLVLPLNASSPTFSLGPDSGLPPHAFAAMSVTSDSSELVVVGGMTSSCSSDALTHSLSLDGDSWSDANPTRLVRRRGADMVYINDGSTSGKMMIVGGISDTYVCASSSNAFAAADILSLPLNTTSVVSTRSLPTSLTGTELAVADFAMTTASDGTVYLTGGQTSSGDLVTLDTLGVWTTTSGWTSQTTTGDIPAGRVGASLVAHPTLDLLALHGGSTTDGTTDTPSNLLAFLNTTTWTWSTPSNLQPPSSSAAAYHSSIITDSGVMITAFGLGSGNNPRSDVFYLDMRDPTQATWSWKSVWSSSMLEAYSDSTTANSSASSNAGTSNTAGTSNGLSSDASDSSNKGSSAKKDVSIAVPVVVVALLLLPILVYLIRRRVRLIRKRRMARHFALEDDDDLTSSQGPSGRKTKTQYSFGRDANEKDGNFISDLGSNLKGILKRYSKQSSNGPRDSFEGMREMSQVGRASNNHGIKWEEIDFGLGRVDENRREASSMSRDSSFSAPAGSPPHPVESVAFPVPIASTNPFEDPEHEALSGPLINVQDSGSPRLGTPTNDGQMSLVPSVTIEPPTMPPTPAVANLGAAYPAMAPAPAVPASQDSEQGLDWNVLQQELEAKPAFRSISPTATLRSHAHQSPTSPNPSRRVATPPVIPPLDFQRSPSSQTMSLVQSEPGRRASEILPFESSSSAQSPRVVSQPLGARHLAGHALGRRGSAPISNTSSGSATPTATRPSSVHYDVSARRASQPLSPLTPGSPVVSGTRRGSQLRVVNITEGEGQAL
ncbi:hypothetical protein BCR39DRAFT_514933 [Naematelia encephala]|uniref:Galactose oxidase n=1 Tax=Naematelia encephala TaxID=71784 RepID=A0A1Y2BJ65_9TREE|nr:hypothetical protein BCR39DRAFT_514933 [Naematelia encephala]